LARLEEVLILLGQTKPQPEQMQLKEAQQK